MKLIWYPANGDPETTFQAGTAYYLTALYKGFTETDITHQTVKGPDQDGSTYLGSPFGDRELSFEFVYVADTLQDLLNAQRDIVTMFDPDEDGPGTLVWEQEDGTKFLIYAVANPGATSMPGSGNRTNTTQRYTVNLIAHDPFWYSGVVHRADFESEEVPMFPFDFPWDFTGANAPLQTLVNAGSHRVPVYILFTGPITNPSLENGRISKSVGLALDILDGESVEIYTAQDERYAIYHALAGDVSAFPYLDYDVNLSDFVLKPGNNICELTALASGTGASVTVQWRDRYSGV
ncbi:MAG: phage tail family protein [Methanoregula sp.]|nr:phage tail family protein [Methanoregula sp.]MDD5187979.1 phage tail family protein [Methanoregula sp.]